MEDEIVELNVLAATCYSILLHIKLIYLSLAHFELSATFIGLTWTCQIDTVDHIWNATSTRHHQQSDSNAKWNTLIPLQFLGTWYEVERSFYLPEVASSCTTLTFETEAWKNANETSDGNEKIEVAVKSVNQW